MSGLPVSSAQRGPKAIATLFARWLIGLLFVYTGISNLLHPGEVLKATPAPLLAISPFLCNLFASTVPWLEVAYALVLVAGVWQEAAAVFGRWWLALVFISMGISKAWPLPFHFLELVRQYHLVTNYLLLNAIAAALPWFEVYCGLLLLLGVAVRGVGLATTAMLVPFTLLVLRRALEMAADKGIPFCAVKFDCGCGAGEVFVCHKLVENSLLLLLAVWMLAGRGRPLSLRFSLFQKRTNDPGVG